MIGTLLSQLRPHGSLLRDGDSMLLTQTEFNREVSRERIRATRRSFPFCILTIELLGRKQLGIRRRLLIRMLHRNVRLTDQKADLGSNRFAILLVDTPEMGGRAVLDRLSGLCEVNQLQVRLELKVHDADGFDPYDGDLPSHGEGDRRQGDAKWHRVDRSEGRVSRSIPSDPPYMSSTAQPAASNALVRTASTTSVLCAEDARGAAAAPRTDTVSAITGEPDSTTMRGQWIRGQWKQAKSHSPVTGDAYVSSENTLVESPPLRRFIKRSVDVVGASAGLCLTSPILLGSMLVVRLTSDGPALFRQTREGFGGNMFTIYKLRTMVIDAESKQAALREESHRDGPAFKIKNDPRVTKVGHFLRKTCIDELPQLINVLKGEMSLVGPRPLPWHESRACEHWHRRRLDVRPGLTCHWQVNKAAAETFDDWMRMDLQYVDRNSFWQDIRLICRTVLVPITGRGSE